MSSHILFLVRSLLTLSILGFADAAYLTISHYQNVIPPCSLISGCETVLTSSYSVILGIPVALLGVLYYSAMLILTTLFLTEKKESILKILSLFTAVGMLASLYFVSLMAFVLHALCLYCSASALFSFVMFGIGMWIYCGLRKESLKTKVTNAIPPTP